MRFRGNVMLESEANLYYTTRHAKDWIAGQNASNQIFLRRLTSFERMPVGKPLATLVTR